jgi:multidrug efflux pump subunit AcrB
LPQVNIQIDRDKAAAMGVTASAIENSFYDAYGTKWVSTIYGAAVNKYKVLLELAPKFQTDPSALSLLYFKGTGGTAVPLDTLARATRVVGPQSVSHYGQLTSVTIYKGCLIRFRPIMMTMMAALSGAIPSALGYGAGGEARQPLGLVVVGGLIFSQLVTLYLTPVVYAYMAQVQGWLKRIGAPLRLSRLACRRHARRREPAGLSVAVTRAFTPAS